MFCFCLYTPIHHAYDIILIIVYITHHLRTLSSDWTYIWSNTVLLFNSCSDPFFLSNSARDSRSILIRIIIIIIIHTFITRTTSNGEERITGAESLVGTPYRALSTSIGRLGRSSYARTDRVVVNHATRSRFYLPTQQLSFPAYKIRTGPWPCMDRPGPGPIREICLRNRSRLRIQTSINRKINAHAQIRVHMVCACA